MNTGRRALIWPVLLALAIFLVSGATRVAVPDPGFQFSKDKIAHFLVFGLLATAILRIPALQKSGRRGMILAIVLTIAFGGFDEMRQSFTPGRSVEFADWLADSLGAILAATLYRHAAFWRNFLEWKPGKKKARFLFRRTGP